MQLIKNPTQFDVLVTENMFGDILSDEASMLTGSIGMMPSASLSEGTLGMYEPIHGSAPDIAGQQKANPLATILSAAMMLQYSFDEKDAAKSIEDAESLLVDFDDSDIVELEIVQNEPLSATRLKDLRKNYACISNISLVRGENFVNQKRVSKKLMSDDELFKEFYKSVRGIEPSADLIKMYVDCKGGSDETD